MRLSFLLNLVALNLMSAIPAVGQDVFQNSGNEIPAKDPTELIGVGLPIQHNGYNLPNGVANSIEIAGIGFGAYFLFKAIKPMPTNQRIRNAVVGISLLLGGLATPLVAAWIAAGSRWGSIFH